MNQILKYAKHMPITRQVYNSLVTLLQIFQSTEDIFTKIYRGNKFQGVDSVSGPGSDSDQTESIVRQLPEFFRTYELRTILDIPCGDFHWMKDINLSSWDYMGADIVTKLVQLNQQKYTQKNIVFCKLNLIADKLPKVDLVLCRDCLVHLSFEDIFDALRNVCKSNSTYFLTTTFVSRGHNYDIATGMWRTLNLEAAPFNFPPPIDLLNEKCTENQGEHKDKSLGLWKISDIRNCLVERQRDLSPAGIFVPTDDKAQDGHLRPLIPRINEYDLLPRRLYSTGFIN